MATDTLEIFGDEYTGVTGFKATDDNGNTKTYIRPQGTKSITISANGTTTEDVTNYASAQITASVPNTYASGDEGKVVSNGALVSQTSDTVTQNGTVDTTLINSLTVSVSGGGGGITGAVPYSVTFTNGRNATVTMVRILYNSTVLISGYSQGISANTSVTYTDMATDGTHMWFRSTAPNMSISYNGASASFIHYNNYFRLDIPAGFDGSIPFIFG